MREPLHAGIPCQCKGFGETRGVDRMDPGERSVALVCASVAPGSHLTARPGRGAQSAPLNSSGKSAREGV